MTKIFIEACRKKNLSVGIVCRNEYPEEEKNFYLGLGFRDQELIKSGKNVGQFDSYSAIVQSNLVVGLGTSLLVEAANFMQKKVIAFDLDDKHIFTPPTIDLENIISLSDENEAKLMLSRVIST